MPKPKPPAFTRADLDTLTELASCYCIDHCPFKWLKVDVPVVEHTALCRAAQALRKKLAKGIAS